MFAVSVGLLQYRHIHRPYPSDMQHCDEISFGFCGPKQNVFLIRFSTKFQQVSAKRNRKTASVNDKNSHESNQSADPKKALGTLILRGLCEVLVPQNTLHDARIMFKTKLTDF